MADVFISYKRDDLPRVEILVRTLEYFGLSVWWDRSLEQNQDFGRIIEQQIGLARAVIVCWSEQAADSLWVRSEAQKANEQKKYVGCMVGRAPIPLPFSGMHVADLTHWDGTPDDVAWLTLLKGVGLLVGRRDLADLLEARRLAIKEDAAEKAAALRALRVLEETERHRKRLEQERRSAAVTGGLEAFGKGAISIVTMIGLTLALLWVGALAGFIVGLPFALFFGWGSPIHGLVNLLVWVGVVIFGFSKRARDTFN